MINIISINANSCARQYGFTLIEIALVLIILGILANAFLQPIGSRLDAAKRNETEQLLLQIEQAVIGFTVAHGRLPCPAPPDQLAVERSTCAGTDAQGVVPAVTLGLPGHRNEHGAALDAWNQPVRYVVSQADHDTAGQTGSPDFTTSGDMQQVGMGELASDLQICAAPAGSNCPTRSLLANQIPVLFFSTGRPDKVSPIEQENLDHDRVFVHRDYSQVDDQHFDDLMHWIPENLLFFQLLQAGLLP